LERLRAKRLVDETDNASVPSFYNKGGSSDSVGKAASPKHHC